MFKGQIKTSEEEANEFLGFEEGNFVQNAKKMPENWSRLNDLYEQQVKEVTLRAQKMLEDDSIPDEKLKEMAQIVRQTKENYLTFRETVYELYEKAKQWKKNEEELNKYKDQFEKEFQMPITPILASTSGYESKNYTKEEILEYWKDYYKTGKV